MSLLKPSVPAADRRVRARRRAGFSLIELLIVLIIILLLGLISFQALETQIPKTRVQSAAVDADTMLKRMRLRAIRNGTNVNVRIEDSTGGQRLLAGLSGCGDCRWVARGPATVADPAGPVLLAVDVAEPDPTKHARILRNTFPGEDITFQPDGTPTENGTLTFVATRGEVIATTPIAWTWEVRIPNLTGTIETDNFTCRFDATAPPDQHPTCAVLPTLTETL
ncbi:MAG: GspH/FimT family protein [Acidobacteriota bacterium]